MINLILCLTLLNIGITSHSAKIFNVQLDKIENLMKNDAQGDINQPEIVMPCRLENGVSYEFAILCINSDINEILRHYNMNKELTFINKSNWSKEK